MFNYNPKILDLLGGDTKVICAGLGTGKTQSMKQYLSTTTEQILVIVNDIEAQEAFIIDLPNITVYNSNTPDSFYETIRNLNKNHLIITKAKFNQLLTLGDNVLSMFDRVFIDEASGLSPIQLSTMKVSISSIVSALENATTKDRKIFDKNMNFLTYIKDILDSVSFSDDVVGFYHIPTPFETTFLARNFKADLLDLHKKGLAYDIKDFIPLINFISAIENDLLYLGDYMKNNKKHTNILYSNTCLKEYIKESKAKIIILDATATIVDNLYKYLEIPIVEIEKKEYPNLYFHVHTYDNLVASVGRKDLDVTQKILEDIKKLGRKDCLTFCTKFSMELLEDHNFTNRDYIFSGRDIGSNLYREHNTMNIVYAQTTPMHYRALFNKVIVGIEDSEVFTPRELKITENVLMSERLAQLIGRLSIRVDSTNECHVHFYCVNKQSIERVQEFFGLPDENVILYDSVNIGIPKKRVKLEDILYRIERELKRPYEDKIIELGRFIRSNFYSIETPHRTIASWYKIGKNRIEIEKLVERYGAKIEVKKGRNGGTYIYV